MTQGYQLTMVSYSIGVLPMIIWTKVEYIDVTQPWYADDEGALGTYDNIELYFNSLEKFGPSRGYTPNPQKRSDCASRSSQNRIRFVLRHRFKVYNGDCYIGSFIRDDK